MPAYSMNKKRRIRHCRIIPCILLLVIAIFIYSLLFCTPEQYSGSNRSASNTLQPVENTANEKGTYYQYIKKHRSEVGIGNLILVNDKNPYLFTEKSPIVSVYDNKNQFYKVSDKAVSLHTDAITHFNQMMLDFEKAEKIHDIIILSGFRSKEEQQTILINKAGELGKDEAAKRVAQPGYSEHHTGYAMDIGIYSDSGQSRNYSGSGPYGWVNENCGNYGFIRRYDGDKSDITGIIDEPWHYRYVGTPHANIMKERGYCLEEYMGYLKKFDFNSDHLEYKDGDNGEYEMYYVPAADGITSIPVPRAGKYYISGNNTDGFIVTVEK